MVNSEWSNLRCFIGYREVFFSEIFKALCQKPNSCFCFDTRKGTATRSLFYSLFKISYSLFHDAHLGFDAQSSMGYRP